MKKLGIALSLLLPVIAYAEKPADSGNGHMGEQNIQMMAEKMQQMQKCMEKKIRSLCSKGKRDQAQKEALSFGKKMAKHPAMQSMNKCTENIREAMQDMPMPGQDMDFTNRHACDELSGTD